MKDTGITTITDFRRGQRADAGRLDNLDKFGLYTPRIATVNVNIGTTGVAQGAWHRQGYWVYGWLRIMFSGTGINAGTGTYFLTIPWQPDLSRVALSDTTGRGDILGTGFIHDNSATSNSHLVSCYGFPGATGVALAMQRTGSNTPVTGTSPFTFAASDRISLKFAYPAKL